MRLKLKGRGVAAVEAIPMTEIQQQVPEHERTTKRIVIYPSSTAVRCDQLRPPRLVLCGIVVVFPIFISLVAVVK